MPVEDVWAALTEGKWQSFQPLRNISGLDEDSLTRVVNFPVRWNFAESCRLRELRVRRKPGTISPPEIVALLHTLTQDRRVKTLSGQVGILAERVACRVCGGQDFTRLGENQVECSHFLGVTKPQLVRSTSIASARLNDLLIPAQELPVTELHPHWLQIHRTTLAPNGLLQPLFTSANNNLTLLGFGIIVLAMVIVQSAYPSVATTKVSIETWVGRDSHLYWRLWQRFAANVISLGGITIVVESFS